MFEIFLIFVAFVGSVAAGIIDLRTTEIPDQIPYAMIAIGILAHGLESFIVWNYGPILLSFVFGLIFLGFGFLMYYTGQWGGGDAKLLSGIGFLLPRLPVGIARDLVFSFPISFFFNLFLVGAVYMIGYAFVLSMKNKNIWEVFIHDIKANTKILLVINVLIFVVLLILGLLGMKFFYNLSFMEIVKNEVLVVLGIFILFLLWRFTKTVEDIGFKKKIHVAKLVEGDVLLESRVWEGLTKEQVKKIKKSGRKSIWIKEGVRFGVAFPLALLFTFFIGDGIVLLINLI